MPIFADDIGDDGGVKCQEYNMKCVCVFDDIFGLKFSVLAWFVFVAKLPFISSSLLSLFYCYEPKSSDHKEKVKSSNGGSGEGNKGKIIDGLSFDFHVCRSESFSFQMTLNYSKSNK